MTDIRSWRNGKVENERLADVVLLRCSRCSRRHHIRRGSLGVTSDHFTCEHLNKKCKENRA